MDYLVITLGTRAVLAVTCSRPVSHAARALPRVAPGLSRGLAGGSAGEECFLKAASDADGGALHIGQRPAAGGRKAPARGGGRALPGVAAGREMRAEGGARTHGADRGDAIAAAGSEALIARQRHEVPAQGRDDAECQWREVQARGRDDRSQLQPREAGQ